MNSYLKTGQPEEERKKKEEWEKEKKVLIKKWHVYQNVPELRGEYEVSESAVEMFLHKLRRGIYMEQLVAEAEGKEVNPEQFFFEAYDTESGVCLKKYRTQGYNIVEDKAEEQVENKKGNKAETYDALPFMKK